MFLERNFNLVFLIGLIITCQPAFAAVKPAGIFGDNMVLQRDMEVSVWGLADKGEKVTVEIQGMVKTVESSDWGKWMVKIGPFKAGGPCEMKISGKNVVTIKDIMIGDVWLCSGQSNMQWGLKQMSDAATEVPNANYPDIRLTTITGSSAQPKDDVVCQWVPCSPQTVENFSAVGYYFGRDLHKNLKVPIGLITTAEGGSLLRTWISSKMQRSNPVFEALFEDYRTYSARAAEHSKKLKAWQEEARIAKEEGKPTPGGYPPFYEGNAASPGMLYNARIHPLAPFAIKGVVWYQGEYDAMFKNSRTYCDHFSLMIQDWRDLWEQGDFPFLFVQLPWLTAGVEPVEWAEIRDAQRRTLKVKNTGMAVSTDICEPELHPRKKSELGKRLSILARSIAYGEKLVCSGPLFDKVEFKGDKVLLSFTELGGGLMVKGDKLQGFSLAGSDKAFVKADAEIQGNQVLVHSDKVTDPKAVRYAWTDNPIGTLYNQEGFPASCFRTDDW